jgi:hypothetical protein
MAIASAPGEDFVRSCSQAGSKLTNSRGEPGRGKQVFGRNLIRALRPSGARRWLYSQIHYAQQFIFIRLLVRSSATGAEPPDRGCADRLRVRPERFHPAPARGFQEGHPVSSGTRNRRAGGLRSGLPRWGLRCRFPAPGANAIFAESSKRFYNHTSRTICSRGCGGGFCGTGQENGECAETRGCRPSET